MKKTHVFAVVFMVLLQGCASTKYYTGTDSKNVVIKKEAESDSAFSSLNVYLDVYDVDSKCNPRYLGSVALKEYKTQLGFPVNKFSLLRFRFEGSSFLGGSSSSTSFDTLLKPRKGYGYEAISRYRRGIYNVTLLEINKARNKKREIEAKELYECNRAR